MLVCWDLPYLPSSVLSILPLSASSSALVFPGSLECPLIHFHLIVYCFEIYLNSFLHVVARFLFVLGLHIPRVMLAAIFESYAIVTWCALGCVCSMYRKASDIADISAVLLVSMAAPRENWSAGSTITGPKISSSVCRVSLTICWM